MTLEQYNGYFSRLQAQTYGHWELTEYGSYAGYQAFIKSMTPEELAYYQAIADKQIKEYKEFRLRKAGKLCTLSQLTPELLQALGDVESYGRLGFGTEDEGIRLSRLCDHLKHLGLVYEYSLAVNGWDITYDGRRILRETSSSLR